MTVWETIRRVRLARGWSQEVLGEAVGLSQPAVSRMETGDWQPPREVLICVARVLDAQEILFAALRSSPLFHEALALSGIDFFRPDPRVLIDKIKAELADLERELCDPAALNRAAAVSDMCQMLTLLLATRDRRR